MDKHFSLGSMFYQCYLLRIKMLLFCKYQSSICAFCLTEYLINFNMLLKKLNAGVVEMLLLVTSSSNVQIKAAFTCYFMYLFYLTQQRVTGKIYVYTGYIIQIDSLIKILIQLFKQFWNQM